VFFLLNASFACFYLFCAGHQGTWAGYGQPYGSTSYIDEGVHNYQIYSDPNSVPEITDMPLNNPDVINSYTKEFLSGLSVEQDSWAPFG